jgi:hypothetical protein
VGHGRPEPDPHGGAEQRAETAMITDSQRIMAPSCADADADGEAGGRSDQPDDGGLQQHRAEHLQAGGAKQPQHRELAGAAGDQHREGVPDDERANQQRNGREGQEGGAEPVEVALDLARLPGGERGGGHRLQPPGRQQAGDPVAYRVRAHPRGGAHPDLVDGVAAAEQALCRGGPSGIPPATPRAPHGIQGLRAASLEPAANSLLLAGNHQAGLVGEHDRL